MIKIALPGGLLNTTLVYLLLTAVGFGSWPIINRYLSINGPWVGMLIMAFTTICVAVGQRFSFGPLPSNKALLGLAFGAALNAVGMISYTPLIERAKVSPGLIPASAVMMIVYQSLAGVIVCGDVPTPRLVIGVLTGCLTAWLLSPT